MRRRERLRGMMGRSFLRTFSIESRHWHKLCNVFQFFIRALMIPHIVAISHISELILDRSAFLSIS